MQRKPPSIVIAAAMQLLDLPGELMEAIVGTYVHNTYLGEMFQSREVCSE
jgi:hypothetical protein